MRVFIAKGNWSCEERQVVEKGTDKSFTLTQPKDLFYEDYYTVRRAIAVENVPVDGSTKMEDALMESIEPFDVSGAVDFQTAYLSGYLADKYDVDANSCVPHADERMNQTATTVISNTVTGAYGELAS